MFFLHYFPNIIQEIQSIAPEYLQKIHLAVSEQLKLADQNLSSANAIAKRSKKQRSICIDQILDNANLWAGFIQDISLRKENLNESFNNSEREVA